ncbi:MAG: biotin-dependent carboxyltransferase family protein [Gilvibacter sp.]
MIKVISPGMYSSLQDSGRIGYRSLGVPVSGAMDSYSAHLAQQLVGNANDALLLEFAQVGPVLEFAQNVVIAVTGAPFVLTTATMILPMNRAISIAKGTQISFGRAIDGMYGYLAVQGGFDSEIVLGSGSYQRGITEQITLKSGQRLQCKKHTQSKRHVHVNPDRQHVSQIGVPVLKGPEFSLLSDELKAQLIGQNFTISTLSNRMGARLSNKLAAGLDEIITAVVQPGTVQLTPSGSLIVLMRDAQTTGGYARILQLTEQGINTIAQKPPGAKIKFQLL